MEKGGLIFIFLIISLFIFNFVSAELNVGFTDSTSTGEGVAAVRMPAPDTSFNNNTANINRSNYWDNYGSANSTQFDTSNSVLTILESWLNGLYCQLTGCTMAGNIDMGTNDLVNAGSIGIGTDTLSYTLDIQDPIGSYPTLGLTAPTTSDYIDIFLDSGGNQHNIGYAYDDGYVYWTTPDGDTFYFMNDGKLGIGRESPTNLLTIAGSITADNNVNATQLCINNNCINSWGAVNITQDNAWSMGVGTIYNDTYGVNLGLGLSIPQASLHINASSGSIRIDNPQHTGAETRALQIGSLNDANGEGYIYLYNQSGTKTMQIQAWSDSYILSNGHFGIGTNVPTETLTIKTNIAGTLSNVTFQGNATGDLNDLYTKGIPRLYSDYYIQIDGLNTTVGGINYPFMNSSDGISYNTNVNISAVAEQEVNNSLYIYDFRKSNSSIAVANIPFEPSGAQNATDYSMFSNNGTATGGMIYNQSGYGGSYAYYFAGDEDYIDFGTGASLDVGNNMTVMAWVYPISFVAYDGIVSFTGSNRASTYTWLMSAGAGGEFQGYIGGQWKFSSGASFAVNKWNHVALVYNVTGVSFYYGGEYLNTVAGTLADCTACHLFVGEWYGAGDYGLTGVIDDVRLYNYDLSPEQIKAIYLNKTDTIVSQETTNNQEWDAWVYKNNGSDISFGNTSHIIIGSGSVPTTGTINDTFKWSKDNWTSTEGSKIAITGTDQILDNGVYIQFGQGYNHTLGTNWTFSTIPENLLGIQNLSGKVFGVDSQGYTGINVEEPSVPLTVNLSAGSNSVSIWALGNVSATGYITRTSIFDKAMGSVWNWIKDADYYKNGNEIIHNRFYGYTNISYPDKTKPVFVDGKVTYPYNITEEGVSLDSEINLNRQGIFENHESVLDLINDVAAIKNEICILNPASKLCL